MRKELTILFSVLVCVMMAFSLAGCASQSGETLDKRTDIDKPAELQKETLNFMGHWKGEDKRETIVHETVKEFEALHPGLDVNMQWWRDIAGKDGEDATDQDYVDYLVDMIQSGDIKWDVIWMNSGRYRDIAEKLGDPNWGSKYLVNFDEVSGFDDLQMDFITGTDDYRTQYGGFLTGPFIEGFYIMLWYNKEVADKVGIEVKDIGMSYEDLLSYVKAVDEYNKEHGTHIAAIYESKDWITSWYIFERLITSELGRDIDFVKEEVMTDAKKAALLKTLQAFEELGKYHPLIDSHAENVWFDNRNKAYSGEALFYPNGAWMYSHWMGIIDSEETLKSKVYPAELPVFQPVDYYMGSFITTWAVLKDAPNRDRAVEFMLFWSRPQTAEKWVRYTKAPTGVKGSLSTPDLAEDQYETFNSNILAKYNGKVLLIENPGFFLGEENKLNFGFINQKLIQLLDGEITAQGAYDEIMAKIS